MDVFAERFDVAAMVGEVAASAEALVARKNNRLVLDLPSSGSPAEPASGRRTRTSSSCGRCC